MFEWSQLSFTALFAGMLGLSLWNDNPQGMGGQPVSKSRVAKTDYLKEMEHGSFNLPYEV